MATVTPAQFRQDFPAFSDTLKYPDSQIQFWLNFAVTMLPEVRWGAILSQGIELMTAHQLAFLAVGAGAGGKPGAIAAPTTSKTVDKVSVSYDTSAVRLENAGHWGGTAYGLQFLQLARMVGMGGLQL